MPLCTVSGNISNILGVAVASGTVRFTLTNLGSGLIPMVLGTNLIVPLSTDVVVSSGGAFSVQLQGNDTITPAGTLYQVNFYAPAGAVVSILYSITGSVFNLNTAAPVTTVPPIVYGYVGFPNNSNSPITLIGVYGSGNTVYTFPTAPGSIVLVFRNGILQRGGGVDYTLAGTTLTFAGINTTSDYITIVY